MLLGLCSGPSSVTQNARALIPCNLILYYILFCISVHRRRAEKRAKKVVKLSSTLSQPPGGFSPLGKAGSGRRLYTKFLFDRWRKDRVAYSEEKFSRFTLFTSFRYCNYIFVKYYITLYATPNVRCALKMPWKLDENSKCSMRTNLAILQDFYY